MSLVEAEVRNDADPDCWEIFRVPERFDAIKALKEIVNDTKSRDLRTVTHREFPRGNLRNFPPTRHATYKVSQQPQADRGTFRLDEDCRRHAHCGRELVEWFFMLTAAAYNLIRIPKILAAAG
jgi:hypothetical protein